MTDIQKQTVKRCYSFLKYHNISLEDFSKLYNEIKKEEEDYLKQIQPQPEKPQKKSNKK